MVLYIENEYRIGYNNVMLDCVNVPMGSYIRLIY